MHEQFDTEVYLSEVKWKSLSRVWLQPHGL